MLFCISQNPNVFCDFKICTPPSTWTKLCRWELLRLLFWISTPFGVYKPEYKGNWKTFMIDASAQTSFHPSTFPSFLIPVYSPTRTRVDPEVKNMTSFCVRSAVINSHCAKMRSAALSIRYAPVARSLKNYILICNEYLKKFRNEK